MLFNVIAKNQITTGNIYGILCADGPSKNGASRKLLFIICFISDLFICKLCRAFIHNIQADHIIDTFFYEGAVYKKIIIFGHHQIVLDYIQMTLEKKQIKSIRIDGTTSSKDRATLCDQFQNDPTTFAAVLSITAAGSFLHN